MTPAKRNGLTLFQQRTGGSATSFFLRSTSSWYKFPSEAPLRVILLRWNLNLTKHFTKMTTGHWKLLLFLHMSIEHWERHMTEGIIPFYTILSPSIWVSSKKGKPSSTRLTVTHKQHTNLMEGIFHQWLMTRNLSHQVRQWFVTKKSQRSFTNIFAARRMPIAHSSRWKYWKLNWKDYEQNASTKPPVDGQNPAGLRHPVMVVVDPIVGLLLYSLVNGWSHVHQQATFSGSSLCCHLAPSWPIAEHLLL